MPLTEKDYPIEEIGCSIFMEGFHLVENKLFRTEDEAIAFGQNYCNQRDFYFEGEKIQRSLPIFTLSYIHDELGLKALVVISK